MSLPEREWRRLRGDFEDAIYRLGQKPAKIKARSAKGFWHKTF
jgi:hypothetical protein